MKLIFDTDLQPYFQGRRFTSCFVSDVNGSIVPARIGGFSPFRTQPKPVDQEAIQSMACPSVARGKRRCDGEHRCDNLSGLFVEHVFLASMESARTGPQNGSGHDGPLYRPG
jgi:hypothetical protein